jgi:hypothetical protein
MNRDDRRTLEQLQAQILAAQTTLAELRPELAQQRWEVDRTTAAMAQTRATLQSAWSHLAVLQSGPSPWRNPDLQARFAQLLVPLIGAASVLVALWCCVADR